VESGAGRHDVTLRRVVLLGALALGCHAIPDPPDEPHTAVQVLNQCHQTMTVGDKELEYWTSWPVYVLNGETESIPLSDSAGSLGTLVITSLVSATDPQDYHAAVNLQASPPGHVFSLEVSPVIEAEVVNPR
jgi:hypothetical protein